MARTDYDEFGLFAENAEEYGIAWAGPPVVRRAPVVVDAASGRRLSALVWGDGPPELVLLHGGAQNAHTWDTVALALDRPLVAVDLPGHGHSDPVGAVDVRRAADDVALVVRALAPDAAAVVGMSLGGITSIALAAAHPDLVRRMVLVDITPGVDAEKAKAITAFVDGPETFPDFDALLARTIEHNPTRTVAALRRGILHNAEQLDDGSWRWRYRRPVATGDATPPPLGHTAGPVDHGALWDELGAVTVPVLLARGLRPQSVVDDADEAELLRRLPDAAVEHFAEAGHSIQGDMPVELAATIARFIER